MNQDRCLAFLSAMELRESALLMWGATGAEWTEAEIERLLADQHLERGDFDDLLEMALVVRTPSGGYRSRAAETVRLLASLRQSFPSRPVTDGRRLVLDYRFLHRPRRRPARSISRDTVLTEDVAQRAPSVRATVRALLPSTVSGFQQRSLSGILGALEADEKRAVMVSAGTGSGKTLAFYLPVLAHTVKAREEGSTGPTVLAVYPRNELLKDQLRTLLWYVLRLAKEEPTLPVLRVGAWFGPTPYDTFRAGEEPPKAWRRRRSPADGGPAFVCPFLVCPDPECGGDLLWTREDMRNGHHRLGCSVCGLVVDETHLNLTRVQAKRTPPDVMLTTTESLNRQLSSPSNLRAFGVSPSTLQVVLLDEVHVYQGVSGAQNAYLFRRLTDALKRPPTWVALSATLTNPEEFLAQVIGLSAEQVTLVTPALDEMEEAGAEYLLALRHDPTSGAGTLSTTIQTIIALARILDPLAENPFDPPVDSQGVFGKKVFAFTDKLDVTNRLFWDLNDAEGWAWPGQVKAGQSVLTLAHLRSNTQGRLDARLREEPLARDLDGQWWWLPEYLGHAIDDDRQLDVDRTSSQDRGLRDSAQVVVATSTLEVGYDDSRIGAVVQHKAPHSAASFLQRKGRAGRDQITRPWTVVVLSDWGRDREAWLAYDWLFSPTLPPTRLPLDNRYIQRIQAVYALMDWISREIPEYRYRGSTWSDLTAPADVLGGPSTTVDMTRTRQAAIAKLLGSLLGPGPSVTRLRRHLIAALGLPKGDRGDQLVDEIFWDGPRPLLLVVVPTIVRRLKSNWEAESPDPNSDDVTHRVPLREFVPGNLFGELMSTDVMFTGPGLEEAESPYLPALRTLRDFMPGTVSRHFGVRAQNKRHWVPLPEGQTLLIDGPSPYQGAYQCTVQSERESPLPVYAPTRVALEAVPGQVRDFSRVEPLWESELSAVGSGRVVELPMSVAGVFAHFNAFLHSSGDGVRVVRFARKARGAVFSPERQDVEFSFTTSSGQAAALGQEMLVDGLGLTTARPNEPPISPAERAERLLWLISHDPTLDEFADRFARQTLGEAALVIRADRILRDPVHVPDLGDHLAQAAYALGRLRAHETNHLPGGDDGDDDVRGYVDADWLTEPSVLDAVRTAIDAVDADSRSDEWRTWWQRRFTITAASVLVEAIAGMAEGVDVADLNIDLTDENECAVWITEKGPGGLGSIEALVRAISENPDLIGFAIENVLVPGDLEQLDAEIVPVLKCTDPSLREAMDAVRNSWDQGHAAVKDATDRLEATVEELGLPMSATTHMALTNRVLAPGATDSLDLALAAWIDVRDRLHSMGAELDARGLAAVVSTSPEWDAALRLEAPSRATRARRIANLLWPWGREATGGTRTSPLTDQPVASIADLRSLIDVSPSTVVVSEWNQDVRTRAEEMLATSGTVRLRFEHGRGQIRLAILDLQVRPLEVQTLLLHPRVAGVRETTLGTDVWLHLEEVRP